MASNSQLLALVDRLRHMPPEKVHAVLQRLPADEKVVILELLEELGLRKKRQMATEKFMEFVHAVWPNFIEGKHHIRIANLFEQVARGELKRLIINLPPRHRLALDTPIATLAGWKTIDSVSVGDYVFAPDGKPVLVTGKSEVYEEELYEVKTSDGQTIKCDGEHLWTVRFGSPGRPFITLTTRDLLHRLETENWRKHDNLPILPPYKAVEYPDKPFIVDPYVLGVWLGDGAATCGTIGSPPWDAPFIRERFEAVGVKTTTLSWDMTFGTHGLMVKLREIGVLNNKHIPEEYLSGSVAQRQALLQGLIDTDGSVDKNGKVEFGNSNLRIIESFLCLVHSLGIKARITSRQGYYRGVAKKMAYRVMFKYPNAASLPRKAANCRELRGNWARSIDVRRLDMVGKVQCLEVANDDGLFLAGRSFICTHNTKSEFASYLFPAWFLGKFPHKKIIQASHTAELAVGFGRKVRNLVDSETYQTIFPQVKLQSDSKAAGRWNTNFSGDYFAVGVGGAVAGKGADLCLAKETICIIDDSTGTKEKQIQYVNIGDSIKTANGWEKVTHKKLTIHDRYVRINGDIRTSREHRFLTTEGWKEAKDLRIGDRILTNSIWRRLWVLLKKIFPHKNQPEKLGKV